MLAMVARHPFRMMLPVSASASCSSSMISSSGSSPPVTARTSSRLLVSGKISSARPVMSPSKTWWTATRLLTSFSLERRDGRVAAHQRDLRHREQDLLAHHLAQAGGGAADADIDHFRQGIELELGREWCVIGSRLQPLGGFGKEIGHGFFGQRLLQEGRADLARPRHDLVLMIGGDDGERHRRLQGEQLGRELEPVAARHVEVEDRDVDAVRPRQRQRLVGVCRLDAHPVRLERVSALATAMRASLLSSTTRTLYLIPSRFPPDQPLSIPFDAATSNRNGRCRRVAQAVISRNALSTVA